MYMCSEHESSPDEDEYSEFYSHPYLEKDLEQFALWMDCRPLDPSLLKSTNNSMGMLSSHIANGEPDLEEMDNYLTLHSPPLSSPTTRSSPPSSSSSFPPSSSSSSTLSSAPTSSATSSSIPFSPQSPCPYSPTPTPTLALSLDPDRMTCAMDISTHGHHNHHPSYNDNNNTYEHHHHHHQHQHDASPMLSSRYSTGMTLTAQQQRAIHAGGAFSVEEPTSSSSVTSLSSNSSSSSPTSMSLVPTQSTNGGIQGKRLYLFIRSPDGDLIAMQANRRMKVIEFKATINRQIKVPVDLQMLLYNGKHMEDRQPLAAYNLPRDATIDVRIRAHASNGTRSLTIQEPEFDDPQQLRWNGNGEGPSTSGPSSSSSGPMSPGSLAQLEEEPPSCSHVRTDTAALFEDEYNEQREGMRETIAQMEGLVEHMKRLGSQQDNSNMEMRRLLNRTIGRKRHFKSLFVDMRSSSHALQSALDRSNEAIDDLRGKNADLAKFDRENYEKLSLEQLEQMEEDMERCLKHLKKFKKRKLRAYRSEISKQVRAMCVACETNERRTTLVPCGHFALCSGCAEKASECPICHAAITQRIATNFC